MPTRIVREGLLTSEPVNALSPKAELFYRRLMSVADDYGRFFAHASILRAHCYPMQLDAVSESDVKKSLAECTATNPPLVTIYGSGKYLSIAKFRQQTRGKSKFPEPTPEPTQNELLIKSEAKDKQPCSLVGDVGVVGDVGGCVVAPAKAVGEREAEIIYESYPRRVGRADAIKAIIAAQKKRGATHLLGATKAYAAAVALWPDADKHFVPYPATWFNRGSYDDDHAQWVRCDPKQQDPYKDFTA